MRGFNILLYCMTKPSSSAYEDMKLQLKAPEQAGKWPLSYEK